MPESKIIRKFFGNAGGLDYRRSDLTRDPNNFLALRNVVPTKDGRRETRPGCKILGPEAQYLGLWKYAYADRTTGAITEELLSIGQNLHFLRSNTFTITYSGAASVCYFTLSLDTSTATFKAVIVEGSTTVLDYDLGTGLEASPIDLADLKTQIDAITDFAATISGVDTVPAAFLPITLVASMAAAPNTAVLTYYDWAQINSTVTNPFSSYFSARGGDAFRHATFTNFQDCAFIATGYETLHKYDGQTVYRAGLPQPSTAPSLANGGAGSVDTGAHTYLYIYRQVDNVGNITESRESATAAITLGGGSIVNATVANVVAGTGFNTNCAIVNGIQAGVTTITVDAGHTMRIGDTAYFFDGVSSSYVEREVTNTAATTITIAGANVNVADNAVISNNLRILIFRTKVGGIDYFQVAEIPNDSINATQVYADNTADASLGAQYFLPQRKHDVLSVKPSYVTSHDGVLVCSGAFSEPNTVFFSSDEDLESFPTASNSFDLPSTISGPVTGLYSDQEFLVVGKQTSLFVISGGLNDSTFRVEKINEGVIGIASHSSIADVGGGIMFLSNRGWYSLQGGFNLIEIGEPVNKIFFDTATSTATTLRAARSVGVFDESSQRYLCFVPTESGSGTGTYANSNSLTLVYDIVEKQWFDFTGLNMGGGAAVFDGALWWQSKRDDPSLTVTGNLFKRLATSRKEDYADHTEVIAARIEPQWEDGGEPGRLKAVQRIEPFNVGTDPYQTEFDLTFKTERDYQYGLAYTTLVIPFNQGASGAGWGLFFWGLDPWGSPASVTVRPRKLRTDKAKAYRFLFSHGSLHQKMSLSGYSYELVILNPAGMSH